MQFIDRKIKLMTKKIQFDNAVLKEITNTMFMELKYI